MLSQTLVPKLARVPEWVAKLDLLGQVRVKRLVARPRALAKRLLDLVFCALAMPVALPLMAVIALLVMLDSGRPVLFVQERIGRGGRRFRMLKFRSLRRDYADSRDRQFMKEYIQGKIDHNSGSTKPAIHKPFQATQVTRLGRILRRTSLDELPQIFNVLRGEMSIVGPRPNVPWEVEAYRVWHTERLEVLPGITGLSQVRGRSGLAWDQMARYDIEYVRNADVFLDIKIMWWTVASILSGRGAG